MTKKRSGLHEIQILLWIALYSLGAAVLWGAVFSLLTNESALWFGVATFLLFGFVLYRLSRLERLEEEYEVKCILDKKSKGGFYEPL